MNRFTIAILVVALLAVTQADGECRIFSCGTITQGETGTICAQRAGEAATDNFNLGGCQNTDVCQAWKWNTPADATEDQNCGADAPEAPAWGRFNRADNGGLDGDHCTATADCYVSEQNAATCNSNVCTAATKAGDACGQAQDCPRGHTCGGDGTCVALLASGKECTTSLDCARGLSCAKTTEEGAQATCMGAGAFKDGQEFMFEGEAGGSAGICQNGNAFVVGDHLQCRQLPRNKDQNKLTQATPGENCAILTFDKPEAENFDQSTETNVNSYCGFNKDNAAYCPRQPGDTEVLNQNKAVESKINGFNCHRLSGTVAGSICAPVLEWQNSKEGWNFYSRFSLVGTEAGQAWANVANNDKCVAEGIMSNFWGGHFGDSAFGLTVVASAAATILSFVF